MQMTELEQFQTWWPSVGQTIGKAAAWEAWQAARATPKVPKDDAEQLAKEFHETYERLAPQYGYETREETRAFDASSPNGQLMIAVCREIKARATPALPQGVEEWIGHNQFDAYGSDPSGGPSGYQTEAIPVSDLRAHLSGMAIVPVALLKSSAQETVNPFIRAKLQAIIEDKP